MLDLGHGGLNDTGSLRLVCTLARYLAFNNIVEGSFIKSEFVTERLLLDLLKLGAVHATVEKICDTC